MRELEWNPGEPMTEEDALSVVESMKQFIRARYFFGNKAAFNGKEDFDAWMLELDGLERYIEKKKPKMSLGEYRKERKEQRKLEKKIKTVGHIMMKEIVNEGRLDECELAMAMHVPVGYVKKLLTEDIKLSMLDIIGFSLLIGRHPLEWLE